MQTAYLDNNATTQPDPAVIEAMTEALQGLWANPSSVHRAGQMVRHAIDQARQRICRLIGCRPGEFIFTSGATEANNLALRGIAAMGKGRRTIITTAAEHSAIREPLEAMGRDGFNLIHAPIDGAGRVVVEQLESLVGEQGDDLLLVSIHWANNETGVIQPVEAIGRVCRAARVPFHSDATQAIGKLPVNLKQVPVDALSLSAHKFHGPKGSGGLYVRSSLRMRPQIVGGPHERQRRGGTENVAGIIGMGVAADQAGQWLAGEGPAKVAAMRDAFEQRITDAIPDARINVAEAPRLINTTSIAFPALEAEAIVVLLSERGVYASAGAACSSGSLEPSPVLLALGLPEPIAHGSVRFSLSRFTEREEIDHAAAVLPAAIGKLRKAMPTGSDGCDAPAGAI
jgi:cysteine desulfurase